MKLHIRLEHRGSTVFPMSRSRTKFKKRACVELERRANMGLDVNRLARIGPNFGKRKCRLSK